MPKTMRRRNPASNVLPHMDRAYPIRPLVNPQTQTKVTILVLPIPGGRQFVASTLEDPKVSVVASTRKSAQDAAMRAYVEKHAPKKNTTLDDEDVRDMALIRKARKEPRVSWQLVKRRAGL